MVDPKQAGDDFRREFDLGGQNASGRAGLPRNLGVHHIAEDAVGSMAGFPHRHRPEIEVVEDVAEGGLDMGFRQPNKATSPDSPAAQKWGANEKVQPLSVVVCRTSGVSGE